ncbi:MAG: cohesin domain-containing protein [Patescibacteria group bacterium]
MNKLFLIGTILMFCFAVSTSAKAAGASLYFSPTSGTFYVGGTFDISILLNTNSNNVNAVRVDVEFDPKKLQIANPTAGKSFISVWVAQPSYSNEQGRATFRGGSPSPGINTSAGLVSTITFRAIAPGETTISFLETSLVLLDDGKGTNILSSLGQGQYSLKIPPPAGPKVFSSTHSDQNKWYRNNSPTFSWGKETLVTDFSYAIDHDFYGIPDNISEGDQTSVSYADLADGLWYFHVKAKKGGGWGDASNFPVQIDTTPPAVFSLTIDPKLKSSSVTSQEPIISFITTDSLSGLDHFELKTINLHQALLQEDTGFFVEVNSPYKLPSLETGEYAIIVRAFDKAINWRETSEKIDVIPVDQLFYMTKRGINVWALFLSWGELIFVLLPLTVFCLLVAFYYGRRKYREVRQKKNILENIKKKTEVAAENFKGKITPVDHQNLENSI